MMIQKINQSTKTKCNLHFFYLKAKSINHSILLLTIILCLSISSCQSKEDEDLEAIEVRIKYFKENESFSDIIIPCSYNFENINQENIVDTIIKSYPFKRSMANSLRSNQTIQNKDLTFNVRMKVYISTNGKQYPFCIDNEGTIRYKNIIFKNNAFCFYTRIYSGYYCYLNPQLLKYLPEYPMIVTFKNLGGVITDKSDLFETVKYGIDADSIPYEIIKRL